MSYLDPQSDEEKCNIATAQDTFLPLFALHHCAFDRSQGSTVRRWSPHQVSMT